jgi:hypothetical protein
MSGESILTFVVFACHMNVGPIPLKEIDFDSDRQPSGCRVVYEEILTESQMQVMSPMSCIMQSPIMAVKFMEGHPGWEPRKWTCKYMRPFKKI